MNKSQKRVKRIVESMKEFINTYENQSDYLDYSDTTLLDDFLYGIGTAFRPEAHRFAQGYQRFKRVLKNHIDK